MWGAEAAGQKGAQSRLRSSTGKGSSMGQGAAKQTRALLDYTTEKYVVTRNRKVGLIHRLLQLGILLYMLV